MLRTAVQAQKSLCNNMQTKDTSAPANNNMSEAESRKAANRVYQRWLDEIGYKKHKRRPWNGADLVKVTDLEKRVFEEIVQAVKKLYDEATEKSGKEWLTMAEQDALAKSNESLKIWLGKRATTEKGDGSTVIINHPKTQEEKECIKNLTTEKMVKMLTDSPTAVRAWADQIRKNLVTSSQLETHKEIWTAQAGEFGGLS